MALQERLKQEGRVFETGHLVRLNSGGPIMTVDWVENCDDEHMVHVVWFDGAAQQGTHFNALMLESHAGLPW